MLPLLSTSSTSSNSALIAIQTNSKFLKLDNWSIESSLNRIPRSNNKSNSS